MAEAKSSAASTTPIVALSVKQQLIAVFGKDSIMLAIASCESHFRQFKSEGVVLRGDKNPKDIGVFQINEYWNGEEAVSLGYDIYTLEGNIKMAQHIYKTRGTQPWNWSKPCWGAKLSTSTPFTATK